MIAGDRLGHFELVSLLGKGAMGEVWRARDQRLDRAVAIKLLPAAKALDPERKARMLREAKAAAAVQHPGVVTLFDIDSVDGRDLLVMELVEGQTVAAALAGGPPPLEVGVRWVLGVVDALVAAHEHHILHRDIKAANVMVTPAGTVKVLDFGLAKLGGPGASASASASSTPSPSRSTSTGTGTGTGTGEATRPGRDVEVADTVASGDVEDGAYLTHAGSLLGTPMYMAPEQLTGAAPDERTEVFSVGILAHEILGGRAPYRATTLDELFAEIAAGPPRRLDERVPAAIAEVIARATAHEREARYPTMTALRDALVGARDRAQRARRSRGRMLAAALALALVAAAAVLWWRTRPAPPRPGDAYVTRALDEYDVFFNDKALASLRAALRADPEHPRALAYLILLGGTDDERAAAAARGRALLPRLDAGPARTLLSAAITLEEQGAAAAGDALAAAGGDYELGFWAAELAYRSGAYQRALAGYQRLDRAGLRRFRGRIYDHYSAVLLLVDEPDTALAIGERYHQAYPGEADAVGVHATTLAAAGRLDEALPLAEEALTLYRSEDTVAGLGKVRARRGELVAARALYAESLALAPPARRTLRRAALGLLLATGPDADLAAARAAVAPCLPGGADAAVRERPACLLVAALLEPPGSTVAATAAAELERLADEASPTRPAYGDPRAMASWIHAHQQFSGGGCLLPPAPVPADLADRAAQLERDLAPPVDFHAGYHVPLLASWAVCERAHLAAALGDRARAAAILAPVAERSPGRWWLLDDLAALRAP